MAAISIDEILAELQERGLNDVVNDDDGWKTQADWKELLGCTRAGITTLLLKCKQAGILQVEKRLKKTSGLTEMVKTTVCYKINIPKAAKPVKVKK